MGDGREHADTFRAFYRAHYGVILTVAEQRLDTVAAAEDAASETFQIAWRRYADDGAELTLPWVYQILRNVIGTEYRRRARARRAHERMRDDESEADPQTDKKLDLRQALTKLTEGDRDVLFMAYWEDLTGEEMAGILRTSPGAVRVRLTRARAHLRSVLAQSAEMGGHERG